MLILAGYSGMFFFLPIGNSPVEICGAFVLAVWIVSGRFLGDVKVWMQSGVALSVLVLVALPWVGLFYTPAPSDGLHVASKGYRWLFSIAMISAVKPPGRPELMIRMFLAGLSLSTVASLLQVGGIIPSKYGSPSGFLGIGSPWITYSLLLTIGIFIASFYFRRAGSRRGRLINAFLMIQYFVTIGFVGGRSGYVAFIVLSPLIIYNITGKVHFFKILAMSITIVAILFTFPVVQSRFSQMRKDLELYRQGDVNTSIGLRFHMWEISVSEIAKHPLLGVGTEGFRKSWETKKRDPSLPTFDHPHNSFLYMMVSFGIAGLVAFCRLLFVLLRRGWLRRDTPMGFALFSFTVVFIIGSLTDTQLLPFPTAMALTLFAGISAAMDVPLNPHED